MAQVKTSSNRSCSAALRNSIAILRPLETGMRQVELPYGWPAFMWTLVPPPLLWLSVGHKFTEILYNNIEEVNINIIDICAKIVEGGLREEIKAILEENLGEKCTEAEVKTFTDNFIK